MAPPSLTLPSTQVMTQRILLRVIAWVGPSSPLAAYLIGLVLGLRGDEAVWALTRVFPPVILTWGILYPILSIFLVLRRALEAPAEVAAQEQLRRILKFPSHLAFYISNVAWFFGGLTFSLPVCLFFHKSLWLAPLGGLVTLCFAMILDFPLVAQVEELLLPHALHASARLAPDEQLHGSGPFWPRLSWYLPFLFGVSLVAMVVLGGIVLAVRTLEVQRRFVEQLEAQENEAAARLVDGFGGALLSEFSLPLAFIVAFLLIVPSAAMWMLARRQQQGSREVLRSIQALAQRKMSAPRWVSTDEVGDLAHGLRAVLQRLQEIPQLLEGSARQLVQAGSSLTQVHQRQHQSLTQQAAALHQTQVTAEEIKQSSALAATKAGEALTVARRAEALGREGGAAVEQTLQGFESIQAVVVAIRDKVARLQDSARQIGQIVMSVKDLADESNMLALNAAIEAVRSGEHGKGFGVVAREIRSLADQSVRSTARIRAILTEVQRAIHDAVAMSDQGARQIQASLEEARQSGSSLQALTSIVRDNAGAMQQIAAAVRQQDEGFHQIFAAIAELSRNIEETNASLDTAAQASAGLTQLSSEVERIARRFHVE